MKPITSLLAAAVAGASLLGAAPDAFAERNTVGVRMAFHYDTAEPAAETYARLQQEAEQACRWDGSRSLKLAAYERICADRLVEKAVARIADAGLSQQHQYASRHILAGADASGR